MKTNRRRFLSATGLGATSAVVAASPISTSKAQIDPVEPQQRVTQGLIDCQSHLFLNDVIEVMRKRTAEPLVFDQEGVAMLKMGDWLRKIPPAYTSLDVKLAAMDANGIAITLLSTNDPEIGRAHV